jgi:GT2 family glycosyltransferase
MKMTVSVVVRCNGRERLFEGVLARLLSQTVTPSEIVIVMDSDNKREIASVSEGLRSYPASTLLTFEHEQFSHPYSVNLGVASTKEELVCITNGHSMPTTRDWLADGLACFEDQRVAGMGGFFLPSKKRLEKAVFLLAERLLAISPASRFSTINCVIRRSRWEEYPFDEHLLTLVPETKRYGGEDCDWALEMLSRGYKIVMNPHFSVVHAHEQDIALEICRNLRNYLVYRRLSKRIKGLQRPRQGFSSFSQGRKAKT